jgi:Lrp/AsnC family leucine-responsive transcriptional regulator
MEVSLDKFDEKIIQTLLADGRVSNSELAKIVGLSATPCWNRVKRLTEAGVILGYRATIDWAKLGKADTAIVQVALSDHSLKCLNEFCSNLLDREEVTDVSIVTGDHDVEISVVVDGTSGLDAFLRGHVYIDKRISSVRTRFVIRRFLPNSRSRRIGTRGRQIGP